MAKLDTSKITFGISKDMIANNKGKTPFSVALNDRLLEAVYGIRKSLQNKDISASKRLEQSFVVGSPRIENGQLVIEISADFYYKYIEFGVNGKSQFNGAPTWGKAPRTELSFKDAILKWIPERGIFPKGEESFEQVAERIMYFITQKGKKPRPYLGESLNEELASDLEQIVSQFLTVAIESVIYTSDITR